jgi:hypothetical protein
MAFALDFPANPSTDDIHQGANGINYLWDGEKWSSKTQSRNTSLGGNPGQNPPNGAVVGDFWFQTPENHLWIAMPAAVGSGIEWRKTSLRDTPNANTLP